MITFKNFTGEKLHHWDVEPEIFQKNAQDVVNWIAPIPS